MKDNDNDRKDQIEAVVDAIQKKHGSLFQSFPVARQAREVVEAAHGLIQSHEVMVIIRHASGDRPKQAAVSNALSRATEKGLICNPSKGVWGPIPVTSDSMTPERRVYVGGSDPTTP
jgi:hypothetical protein